VAEQTVTAGELASAISNVVVKINAEHHGRGPTKAKTFLLEDVVLVVMEGGATQAELTLATAGEEELALDVRGRVQDAIAQKLRAAVEELLGRRVLTVLSAANVDPDVACTVFVLEHDEMTV
jgi:uncharacterized protein YbcI